MNILYNISSSSVIKHSVKILFLLALSTVQHDLDFGFLCFVPTDFPYDRAAEQHRRKRVL